MIRLHTEYIDDAVVAMDQGTSIITNQYCIYVSTQLR